MEIVKADISDADIVGYVHSTAWKQAYANVFPVEYLYADTSAKRVKEFEEAWRDERVYYYLMGQKSGYGY